MLFTDRAILDGPARITREGHLLATARVARANNIQDYLPSEIGLPPKADGKPYRIFRPADEVFARDAVQSAAHRPITIDHPAEDVSAVNWKRLAVGDTGGEVLRDGEFLRLPIMVMDSAGVQAATTTHQEFSLGYKAELDMTPGTFGDEAFDGSMKDIRINHLALCRHARGGTELRIVDERKPLHLLTDGIGDAKAWLKKAIALHKKHMDGTAPTTGPAGEKSQMLMMEQMENALSALDGESPASRMKMDFNPKEPEPMKIKIGDAEVDATNGEAVRVAVDALNTKLGTLTADLATAKTAVETKDGEIAALNKKLEDATVTPEKLQQMADARAKVIASAQSLKPGIVVDGKSETEIRRAAVEAKLGDAAKGMSDDAIAGAFAAYVPLGDGKPKVQPIGDASSFGDATDIRNQARLSRYAS